MQLASAHPVAHENYFARIRTDLSLLGKPTISEDVRAWLEKNAQASDGSLLDIRNLSYPPLLKRIFGEEPTFDERKAIAKEINGLALGSNLSRRQWEELGDKVQKAKPQLLKKIRQKYKDDIERLVSFMSNGQVKQRQTEWVFRTQQAFEECQGWYPFFVTLTVDPRMAVPREVWQSQGGFQKYIKAIARDAFKWCGYTGKEARRASAREVVRYIACIEHGKSRQHDHVHMMLFIRDIPGEWKVDPNGHRRGMACTERRCRPLEAYWPYSIPGTKPAYYFRHTDDIWRVEHGFKAPIMPDGRPLELKAKAAAGYYLAKYMAKEKKEWSHRIRATRNIGLEAVKAMVAQAPHEELKAVTSRPMTTKQYLTTSTTTNIPMSLIKRLATRVIYQRNLPRMLLDECLETRRKPWQAFVDSVRAGTRPWTKTSLQRFKWLRSVLHPEVPESSEPYEDEYINAFLERVSKKFPKYDHGVVVTEPGE